MCHTCIDLTLLLNCISCFQLYWVGDLIGAVIGAVLYDRIFSTKVCHGWLSTGCSSGSQNEDSKKNSHVTDKDRKDNVCFTNNESSTLQEQSNEIENEMSQL